MFNTLYYPNQIGGAEKSVQLLAEGFKAFGHEPVIVCTSNRNYIDYINDVKVYYIKTRNFYWSVDAKKQSAFIKPFWHLIDSYNPFNKNIGEIMDRETPDIIHTNNLAGFSVSVWRLANRRSITIAHTLRDYYLLCPKSGMFANNKNCRSQCLTCKFYSVPRKLLSSHVKAIIGISNFILNKHLRFGYFKNAFAKHVVFNPVPLPTNVRKKSNNQLVKLGFVGTLAKSKGIEFLLERFSKLSYPKKLLIFGRGISTEYEAMLRDKYKDSSIEFRGFQKPEAIYQEIDILVVPSLWNEPFGRIVPEANSYGIPVLVTNTGGLPELVKNTSNGFVYDPNTVGDFEEKLNSILEMYKNNLFDFDISNFTIDNVINKYLTIFGRSIQGI